MWLKEGDHLFVNLDEVHVVKLNASNRTAQLLRVLNGAFEPVATISFPASYAHLSKLITSGGWYELGDQSYVDLNKCSKIVFTNEAAGLTCQLFVDRVLAFNITDGNVATGLHNLLSMR